MPTNFEQCNHSGKQGLKLNYRVSQFFSGICTIQWSGTPTIFLCWYVTSCCPLQTEASGMGHERDTNYTGTALGNGKLYLFYWQWRVSKGVSTSEPTHGSWLENLPRSVWSLRDIQIENGFQMQPCVQKPKHLGWFLSKKG